jgi:anti-anti-sigma factor
VSESAAVVAEPRGDHVIVHVSGELDVFNAADMTTRMERAVPTEAHGAILDLTGLEFMDSTAIRKLFSLTARLGERRQAVRVVALPGSSVARTLEIVEFSRAAPMDDSVQSAIASLGLEPDGAAPA